MRDTLRDLTESLIYADFREPRRAGRRWSFGHLYPRGHALWTRSGALYAQQMQCLVEGGDAVRAEIRLRFTPPISIRRRCPSLIVSVIFRRSADAVGYRYSDIRAIES
jgi:hypothetical protein